MKYWLGEIKKNGNEGVPKIIVGNKCDLEDQRIVSTEEGSRFAQEKNIPFIETSAKDGKNVTELFEKMARAFLQQAVNQ